jgi:hypothetical protein
MWPNPWSLKRKVTLFLKKSRVLGLTIEVQMSTVLDTGRSIYSTTLYTIQCMGRAINRGLNDSISLLRSVSVTEVYGCSLVLNTPCCIQKEGLNALFPPSSGRYGRRRRMAVYSTGGGGVSELPTV